MSGGRVRAMILHHATLPLFVLLSVIRFIYMPGEEKMQNARFCPTNRNVQTTEEEQLKQASSSGSSSLRSLSCVQCVLAICLKFFASVINLLHFPSYP